jgi:hypothetical protein
MADRGEFLNSLHVLEATMLHSYVRAMKLEQNGKSELHAVSIGKDCAVSARAPECGEIRRRPACHQSDRRRRFNQGIKTVGRISS